MGGSKRGQVRWCVRVVKGRERGEVSVRQGEARRVCQGVWAVSEGPKGKARDRGHWRDWRDWQQGPPRMSQVGPASKPGIGLGPKPRDKRHQSVRHTQC